MKENHFKNVKRSTVCLVLLLILCSFYPLFAFADEDEIPIVEEDEVFELVTPEDDGYIFLPGEEDLSCQYHLESLEFPENVKWENERLELCIDWGLIEEVGVQHGGQACACFSLAYCRTIIDGVSYSYSDFSLGTSEEDAYARWALAAYEGFYPVDKQSAYKCILSELCKGKPVVVRIEGNQSLLHYVAVVGFENVTDGMELSAYNFLILDPGDTNYELENMGLKGFDLKKDNGTYQVEFDTSTSASPFILKKTDYLVRVHSFLQAKTNNWINRLQQIVVALGFGKR